MSDTAIVLTHQDFRAGRKFRVIKAGASIDGMVPIAPYCQQGFRKPLPVGTILTCRGSGMTFGDGVPAVKWADEHDQWICNDAVFEPTKGGMWGGQLPADGYVEPVD
jgi:hypothetical protein